MKILKKEMLKKHIKIFQTLLSDRESIDTKAIFNIYSIETYLYSTLNI